MKRKSFKVDNQVLNLDPLKPIGNLFRIGTKEAAIARVDEMGFTPDQKAFIFADWPEGDEHYSWLLHATREEIESWGEAGEWGLEEKDS